MRAADSPALVPSPTRVDAHPSGSEAVGGYRIEPYRPELAHEWNAFVAGSRNGTFLLERGFMDHHAQRFEEHSLCVRDPSMRLLAVLPANRVGEMLYSHGGLTYGGFVYGTESRTLDASAILSATIDYLRAVGVTGLLYKTIPHIYHRQPAEEDRLALSEAGASLATRQVLSVVPREGRAARQARRRRGVGRAKRAGLEVSESDDLPAFWALLARVLRQRHSAEPVHSLAELLLLRSRFPNRIRTFIATRSGTPVAGALVFETDRVARAQYICADESGRQNGALDALFSHLLDEVYPDKPWFDFGSSSLSAGGLNPGLIAHKEGFGARTVVQDHYLLRWP